MMKLAPTGVLVRFAVILTLVGLVFLLPILFAISALNVGLFMLGSLLITAGILLYLVAVIRELRSTEAL